VQCPEGGPTNNDKALYPRRSRIWGIERATLAFVPLRAQSGFMYDSKLHIIDAAEVSFAR
jgi:hypothetical protein